MNEPDNKYLEEGNLTVKVTAEVVSYRGAESFVTVGSNFLTEKEAKEMLLEFPAMMAPWAGNFNLVTGAPQL